MAQLVFFQAQVQSSSLKQTNSSIIKSKVDARKTVLTNLIILINIQLFVLVVMSLKKTGARLK